MILRITNDSIEEVSLNQQVMTIAEFKDIHNHPWLVTQNFDAVVVDLDSEIPTGYLRRLLGRYIVIPKVPEECTSTIVRLLGDLYPEYQARLMFTFLKDKTQFKLLLEELAETHNWEKYLN